LRNWKLPKFYFLRTSEEPEEFEVVDGQQRLLAIFEFFDNVPLHARIGRNERRQVCSVEARKKRPPTNAGQQWEETRRLNNLHSE